MNVRSISSSVAPMGSWITSLSAPAPSAPAQRRHFLLAEVELAVAQDVGALDGVAQLAHVAGPAMPQEARPQLLGQALARAVAQVELAEEELGEHQDVVAALAQRRQLHGHDRQAVVDVLAQAAFLERLRRRAVGGGDDAHVDRRDRSEPPTRFSRLVSSTRSRRDCRSSGISVISSSSRVPPLARSKTPSRVRIAPVKLPRS